MMKIKINNLSEVVAEYKACKALWIAMVLQLKAIETGLRRIYGRGILKNA